MSATSLPLLISNFFPPAKKKTTLNKSHCTRPLQFPLTLYAHEFLQTLPRGQSETPHLPKNKYPRPGPLETSDGLNLLGWLLHTWTARAELSTRRLRILNPRLWSREFREAKTPWFSRNYLPFSHRGRRSGPQSRKRGPINAHRPKSLLDPKPREPAQSLETLQMPAGRPSPWLPFSAPRPCSVGAPRPAPGGTQTDPSPPYPPGPRTEGNGPARRPAPREGPARPAATAHLRTRPGPGRGGRGEEREEEPSGQRRAPPASALAPEACFQIASVSRGRVSFRRPEIRAPSSAAPRSRDHGPQPRSRGGGAGRQAPPPGGGRPAPEAPPRSGNPRS